MKQYIDIINHVLENGKIKKPVRRNKDGKWEPVDGGVETLACPNVFFSHDMSEGFPILTTKKVAWKTLKVELEGFIKGVTDKQWFQDRKCKIWDEWANPDAVSKHSFNDNFKENEDVGLTEEELKDEYREQKKEAQRKIKDLGPIYGYQWRHFDEHYGQIDIEKGPLEWYENSNGVCNGADQLKNIVDTLRYNPMDRRMVCSAWNPNQISMMALPPCHYAWNVTVIDGKVNLFWAQRSADLMLGVPFNISSYGLLLSLLAKDAGLEVGNLSGVFVDCHIYENQIEGARIQIEREPRALPTLNIEDNHVDYNKSQKIDKFNIFKWNYDNAALKGYDPMDKINFGDVVV